MSDEVYKLIYCSRSRIEGGAKERDAEISRILASARAYNSRHRITGALLFNSGCFAQALEGPKDAVEEIFAKIRRDPRHGEVTILRSGMGERRDFPNWSMAHAQCESEDGYASAAATLEMALARRGLRKSKPRNLVRMAILELLRTLVTTHAEEAETPQEAVSS